MNLTNFYDTIRTKKHIKYLPQKAVKTGITDILNRYPEYFVELQQFKSIVRHERNSPLVLTSQQYPKYATPTSKDPLDQFVAASMKLFDRSLYDSLKGKTKVPYLERALHGLLKYGRPIHTSQNLKSNLHSASAYNKALDDVKALFQGKKFDTLPLKDMFKQLPLDTAAGFPYFKKKRDVLSECRLATTRNYFTMVNGKKIKQQPCYLALRGHLSPIDNIKTRAVWVNSFDNVTLENMLFRNIYQFAFEDSRFQQLMLTGPNTIQRLRDYLNIKNSNAFVNLDFSAWDAFPCRFAARDLLSVFKSVINFKSGEDRVFNYVSKQFLDSILILPDGSAVQKNTGTCTGSLLTAIFNTLLNFLVLKTSFYILEADYQIEDLKLLGDDASFHCGVTNVEDFIEQLSVTLKQNFGLTLNPKKCVIVPPHSAIEEKIFIGYRIRNDQLYRPVVEFFEYLLYTESPVLSISTSFSRVVSYYLLGGNYHPRFNEFVCSYMGHYAHLLSKDVVMDPNVFRIGNLRVIKHVFQIQIDDFLGDGFTFESFQKWDHVNLPFRFTLGYGS